MGVFVGRNRRDVDIEAVRLHSVSNIQVVPEERDDVVVRQRVPR